MKLNGLEMSTMNEIIYQVIIHDKDVNGMNQETKTEFLSELSRAIQTICFAYGVHN
jgi:hypothetical protein